MNNEYLWEKTGEDPEIAKLENALATFRYRENAPPAPAVAAVERNSFRSRLAIAFAAPAFAAFAIAAGLWFRYDETEIIFIHQPPAQETFEKPSEIRTPAVQPATQPKQPVDRRRHGAQFASTRTPRRSQEKVHSRKPATVALTQEERYAYHQLMLALSISSSKLKVVQDAINGVESNETSTKQNDR
jgi:hypothetical protein